MTENGFCMASVSIAIRRCPALPEGVQPSPWEKGKHPHPLSQILRICQLPRKGELLAHPQGLHFIWKLCRYCKKAPPSGELANECEPERVFFPSFTTTAFAILQRAGSYIRQTGTRQQSGRNETKGANLPCFKALGRCSAFWAAAALQSCFCFY